MNNNIINSGAYLRVAREFPYDPDKLNLQINKSWVDIANAVNVRMNGAFPINGAAITGEEWFLTGNQKQQTLRKVYVFTTTTSINHGILINDPDQFTRCWGSYTDGTDSFGIIWGNSGGTIPNNISFYITATQIVFQVDAGAAALTSGRIILEWLSSV